MKIIGGLLFVLGLILLTSKAAGVGFVLMILGLLLLVEPNEQKLQPNVEVAKEEEKEEKAEAQESPEAPEGEDEFGNPIEGEGD